MTAQIDDSFTFIEQNRLNARDTHIFYMTHEEFIPYLDCPFVACVHTRWMGVYYAGDDIARMPMAGCTRSALACVAVLAQWEALVQDFHVPSQLCTTSKKRNLSDGLISLQPISVDCTWERCMFHWCQENWGQTDHGILHSWLLWLSRPLRACLVL